METRYVSSLKAVLTWVELDVSTLLLYYYTVKTPSSIYGYLRGYDARKNSVIFNSIEHYRGFIFTGEETYEATLDEAEKLPVPTLGTSLSRVNQNGYTNNYAPNPCNNNGRCISANNGEFFCDYSGTKFRGKTCSIKKNNCPKLNPCQNNGFCQSLVVGYKCWCRKGFEGKFCGRVIE